MRINDFTLQCVSRLQKIAILTGTIAALVTPFAAKADCNFGRTIGPGGARFQGFLTATNNAATPAATSMNTGFQAQTSAFVFSPGASQPDRFASDLWGRAIGGRMDTDGISTGQVTRKPGNQLATACSTHSRNNYNGVQGGYDFGRVNENGGFFIDAQVAAQFSSLNASGRRPFERPPRSAQSESDFSGGNEGELPNA